jgi:predicted RecB family nuclease
MKRTETGVIYSPSDLIQFVKSPFASWMERHFLETGMPEPDAQSEEEALVAAMGDRHEAVVLKEYEDAGIELASIPKKNSDAAIELTRQAIQAKVPIVYQAAFRDDRFAGFSDFTILNAHGHYEIWDTKLARSPRPYYAVQLCCYAEMFQATTGLPVPERFGVILGSGDKVVFRTEDFIHYYHRVRAAFLALMDGYTGNIAQRPEPLPGADHGLWASQADSYFLETDHVAQVANITSGQVKKLRSAGITTMTALAGAAGTTVRKLQPDTLAALAAQARLQCQTRADRAKQADASARFEVLAHYGENGEPIGLGALPPPDPADVFFDMEGYPLAAGGLEYLFGASYRDPKTGALEFADWWGHDRDEEKVAFEGFIDWVFKRWSASPNLHIYHYAAYEVSALRRLSTRHDTRQTEVDAMLRENVFVDLYQLVRHGLMIGVDSYSIKAIEHLYRPNRTGEVATAMESVVHYARWIQSGDPRDWTKSRILESIRAYNRDDCDSTAQLVDWLRGIAAQHKIPPRPPVQVTVRSEDDAKQDVHPIVVAQREVIAKLIGKGDAHALTLSDLMDFHRRDSKPIFWRKYDRAAATADELRDDTGCIEGVIAHGAPVPDKKSLVQTYRFDPNQECKLSAGPRKRVVFTFAPKSSLSLETLDMEVGQLTLKIGRDGLQEKFDGSFPKTGSLISDDFVPSDNMQKALIEVGNDYLASGLLPCIRGLLDRHPPVKVLQVADESSLDAAIRVCGEMTGGCLVIQGPPGTGKTFTAAEMIDALLERGLRVGVASNSHKAIDNLLAECGKVRRDKGRVLEGIKVSGEVNQTLFRDNPGLSHVESNQKAHAAYGGGVVGGTAWLFSLPDWIGVLDFLFLDEAGQVSLANAVAMAPSARNLVLLGDQMQLEQPSEGSHPGDSGLSSLQYALKDLAESKPDAPVFQAVVSPDYGLFLGESRRMHPAICTFISESVYEGRLSAHPSCAQQAVSISPNAVYVTKPNGIIFISVEHDGNIQRSEEEAERVRAIFEELLGRNFTDRDGKVRALTPEDFLFVAPYNAQVRALQEALPDGARIGSVDKFQGQQAPVCILSLCSSFGEYGSRGLGFILDRNRMNVAISRAQCLAIVVADGRIAGANASSVAEMKLLNLFCKLADTCQ